MKAIVCGALCAAMLGGTAQAVTLDLTSSGSSGTINGATFKQTTYLPTGSGVAGSFLRVQATGTEQGYNTGGGTVLDAKSGVSLNNGDLSVSSFGSTPALLLDVNQPTASSTITLNSLQIYTSPVHDQTLTTVSALGTKVFDLNAGGTNSVLLDGALSSGSGGADALITFSPSLLAGAAPTDAVYVYASFVGAAGGFEEFSLVSNPASIPGGGGQQPGVPEPASLALIPLGIAALATRYRRAV